MRNFCHICVVSIRGFEKLMDCDEATLQTTLDKDFILNRSRHIYGWFQLIIYNFLPFETMQKDAFRDHVKYDRVSTTSFMQYLSKLTTWRIRFPIFCRHHFGLS